MMCFPTGMIYSLYKKEIEYYVKKYYTLSLIVTVTIFLLLYNYHHDFRSILYNIQSMCFSLFVVLLTMKLRIGNRPLIWLGMNLFPLYIYQRIPMIVFCHINDGQFVSEYFYTYVVVCFIITIVMAKFYKYIEIKLK